jgi:lysophospholipase L1-like esterase
MVMANNRRRNAAMALLAGALVLAAVLAYLFVRPGEKTITETEGAAHIVFAANRRAVAAYGDCVTVRWNVESIQAVYLDDNPTIGSGSQKVCVDAQHMPTLKVVLQDGTERDYTLHLAFLLASPLVWAAILAAIMMLLTAVYLIGAHTVAAPFRWVGRWRRQIARTAVLILFGVCLAALILEVGLRFYLTHYATEGERISYLYSQEQIDKLQAQYIGLPYLNYGLSPDYPEHNRLGYRGPDIQIPKPDGIFRIVALGGSTTYGFFLDSTETYPAQLQQVLRDDYGYTNVEVINAGVPFYSTWDSLVNLAFRVLELQPDLVIVYHAINDVYARNVEPDCYSGMNPMRGLSPIAGIWVGGTHQLSRSVLYRYITINMGWRPDPNSLERAGIHSAGVPCSSGQGISFEDALKANPPTYFERNLRNIVAIARANNVQVMLSSWAYFTGSDIMKDYMKSAADEMNVIIARLADELDVPYYDLMGHMPYNPDYWEWSGYHQSPACTHYQAQQYAAFLIDQGMLPAPAPAD